MPLSRPASILGGGNFDIQAQWLWGSLRMLGDSSLSSAAHRTELSRFWRQRAAPHDSDGASIAADEFNNFINE